MPLNEISFYSKFIHHDCIENAKVRRENKFGYAAWYSYNISKERFLGHSIEGNDGSLKALRGNRGGP